MKARFAAALLAAACSLAGCGDARNPPAAARPVAQAAPSAANLASASAFLDYAQRRWPALFPDAAADNVRDAFTFRFHPTTGLAVAVTTGATQDVYVLGPQTGNQLVRIGPLSLFACDAGLASCAPAVSQCPANPAAGRTTGLVIASGDAQAARPGSALPQPMVVRKLDAQGRAVAGAALQVSTEVGTFAGGSLGTRGVSAPPVNATVVTAADGSASISYTLGPDAGLYHLLVRDAASGDALSFCATASTGTDAALLGKVGVGPLPQGVNVDPVRNTVFVGNNGNKLGCDYATFANSASDTMSVVDGATLALAATVGVGRSPIYPVVNPANGKLYVGQTQLQVRRADAPGTQTGIIDGVGAIHQGVVDGSTQEVWFNDSAQHRALVVSASSDSALAATVATGSAGPHGIALDATRRKAYTSNLEAGTASVIDMATRAKLRDIAVPGSPVGIAANSRTGKVYLTLPDTQRIVVVDTATDTVVKTIDVGTRLLEPAVDETTNRVYFTQQTLPYAVLVLDGATDTVLGRHPVGSCPFAAAIDPVRQRLYVTLSGENALQAFDARQLP